MAQAPEQTYVRRNTFGIIAAYSNDSSHILMGGSQQRELLDFGASYSRKLFADRIVNWQYDAELLPLAYNSDPVQVTTTTTTYTNPPVTTTFTSSAATVLACQPASGSGSFPGTGISFTFVSSCTRRWVIGQAMSPIGFRWNFLTRRRIQPFAVGHGGYMYSSQAIPVQGSGTFNFTFDIGAGFEYFRTHSQSIRAEFRYHHISNADTADWNPGIDNAVVQLSYVFGR